MNFRLSNGLKINSDVVSLANISITKDCDWGVLLVRNIGARAIRVKLSLNVKGNIHTSYSLSYRLAAVAASMATTLGWKRIRVIEETLDGSVVFRFRNYAELSKNHAYDLPVLCTLSELMYVDSAGINSIPHLKRVEEEDSEYFEDTNEHGYPQMYQFGGGDPRFPSRFPVVTAARPTSCPIAARA